MNIQNHTRLPDAFWDKLLHAAKKGIGIDFDTSDTIAEMVTARGGYKHGLAWRRTHASIGSGKNRQWVECKHFWFKIWCPIPWRVDNNSAVDITLGYVLGIYKTAAHELRHIADYHINEANPTKAVFVHRSPVGRRIRWENRPHEKRAIQSAEDAIAAYKASPELQKVIAECVVMYAEFMKKYSVAKIRKVKVYPAEPIVTMTKLQHDWMYERCALDYNPELNGKDLHREALIAELRKGLLRSEVDLTNMDARKSFCVYISDMRYSAEPGEARSAGRVRKQLFRRGLWVRF